MPSGGYNDPGMDKRDLNERDICTKFITPALRQAGWDEVSQIREEVRFTNGRIIVRGRLVTRAKGQRADYVLYYKPNIPIAVLRPRTITTASAMGCSRRLDTRTGCGCRSRFRLTATALCFTTVRVRARNANRI